MSPFEYSCAWGNHREPKKKMDTPTIVPTTEPTTFPRLVHVSTKTSYPSKTPTNKTQHRHRRGMPKNLPSVTLSFCTDDDNFYRRRHQVYHRGRVYRHLPTTQMQILADILNIENIHIDNFVVLFVLPINTEDDDDDT